MPKTQAHPIIALIFAISLSHTLEAQQASPPAPMPQNATDTAPLAFKSSPLPRQAGDAATPAPMAGTAGHTKLLKRAEDKNMQLIFLGDSITAYWQRAGLPVWTKYYAPYDAGDLGIPGETTEQTLGHLAGGILDGLNPKVIVILIGTNNIGKFRDHPDWVSAGIQKIVATVHEKLPKSQIILMAIFPCGKKGDFRRTTVEATNAILGRTDFGPHVHFLDIGSKFLDAGGELPKEYFPDRLHPSLEGYQIWADNLQPVLEPLMK